MVVELRVVELFGGRPLAVELIVVELCVHPTGMFPTFLKIK